MQILLVKCHSINSRAEVQAQIPNKKKKQSNTRRNHSARSSGQAAACANMLVPPMRTSASVAGSSYGDSDDSGSARSTQSCDASSATGSSMHGKSNYVSPVVT